MRAHAHVQRHRLSVARAAAAETCSSGTAAADGAADRVTPHLAIAAAMTLLLAAPGAASADSRHLGTFGRVCAPESRLTQPHAAADAMAPRDRGPSVMLTVVLDLACPSTVEALQQIQEFRRNHAAVGLEIFVVDPSAVARIARPQAAAIMSIDVGAPLRWEPGRVRGLAVRTVPYFRLHDARGRVVTAYGVPSLDGMLGALQ
jgi:hypothetical protein